MASTLQPCAHCGLGVRFVAPAEPYYGALCEVCTQLLAQAEPDGPRLAEPKPEPKPKPERMTSGFSQRKAPPPAPEPPAATTTSTASPEQPYTVVRDPFRG